MRRQPRVGRELELRDISAAVERAVSGADPDIEHMPEVIAAHAFSSAVCVALSEVAHTRVVVRRYR